MDFLPDTIAEYEVLSLWYFVFEALSMDQTGELFEPAGLPIGRDDKLKMIARAFVTAFRNTSQPKQLATASINAFQQIHDVLGADQAEAVYIWAKNSHEYNYHPLFVWEWVSMRLTGEKLMDVPLVPLLLPPAKLALAESIIKEFRNKLMSLQARIHQLKETSRSSWDEYIYSSRGAGSPLSWIFIPIRLHSHILLGRQIRNAFSPEEVAQLEAWGNEQAKVLQVVRPVTLVYGELKSPLSLMH